MRESSVKEIKLKKIWVEEAIKHPDTIKREGKKMVRDKETQRNHNQSCLCKRKVYKDNNRI